MALSIALLGLGNRTAETVAIDTQDLILILHCKNIEQSAANRHLLQPLTAEKCATYKLMPPDLLLDLSSRQFLLRRSL